MASIVATAERISEVVGSSSSGSSEVDSCKEISVVKSQLEATKDTITALKNDTRATGLVGDGGYVHGSGGLSAEGESGASGGSLRENSSSKKGCSNTTMVTISSSSSSGSGSDGGGDGGDGALGGWPSVVVVTVATAVEGSTAVTTQGRPRGWKRHPRVAARGVAAAT